MSSEAPSWLTTPCYGLPQSVKQDELGRRLRELTHFHAEHCPAYRNWLEFRRGPEFLDQLSSVRFAHVGDKESYGMAPPLSVSVFKQQRLVSVPDDRIVVQLNSSGTTGQAPSRIFLDAQTARWQSLAMNRIVESYVGAGRFPLLLLDHPGVMRQREAYSARLAAVLGFQRFGRPVLFAFRDESWTLNQEVLEQFQQLLSQSTGLMVGMTAIVWLHFLTAVRSIDLKMDLSRARLFHGGGWKRVERQAVSRSEFQAGLRHHLGLERIHNYYGMVEQVGSIFVECEHGHLHAPSFADVVVRDPSTLRSQPAGVAGILQVVSALPESYPGHSLLTGDLGTIHGHDRCPCGRLGVVFSVEGRIQQLEPRGCSDAVESTASVASG